MSDKPVVVFFYGLFMDPDALLENGIRPVNGGQSRLDQYALFIGKRATLVPTRDAHAYGMLYTLTQQELDCLYQAPGLECYQAEKVVVHTHTGKAVSALCYNLPGAPDPSETNPQYIRQLKTVLQKLGFPQTYIQLLD